MIEKEIIAGCLEGNRDSEKLFYRKYYGKMLAVCERYAGENDDPRSMLEKGFLEVFKNLRKYKEEEGLEQWVKKWIISTAVRQIRSNKNNRLIISTVNAQKENVSLNLFSIRDEEIAQKATESEILLAIKELVSSYRIVFNMFVIDGYSHASISDMINISQETSLTNLEKSKVAFRNNLVKVINKAHGE